MDLLSACKVKMLHFAWDNPKDWSVPRALSAFAKRTTDSISNYKPACQRCNYYKSTFDLEQFREVVGTILERLDKIFIFHIAMQYGLITETDKTNEPIKFFFEEQEKSAKVRDS